MTTQAIDPKALRQALGAFVTGVTVVTTAEDNGNPRGFTANSFTSVSLEPPLILACIANSAASYPVFSEQTHFAVNILAESQKEVSGIFASKRPDKFEQVRWHTGTSGSPILEDTVSWLDCEVYERVPAGDHLILVGRVVDLSYTTDTPLGYCRGTYLNYALEKSAIPDPGQSMCVGAILERNGQIPFVVDSEKNLSLPSAPRIGKKEDDGSLVARLDKFGITCDLNFIYAVFEDEKDNLRVFYRGQISDSQTSPVQVEWAALNDIDWSRIADEAVRSMLSRYVRERTAETFGIYVGNRSHGEIQKLASLA